MANVFDYLDWRGDLTLDLVPLCDVDAVVLSRLSYLPLDGLVPPEGAPVGALMRQLLASKPPLLLPEDGRFIPALAASQRFCEMRIMDYVNQIDLETQTQFAAITVALGDGRHFVAFRGTDGTLVGWKEDFNMAFTCPVPAQRLAARYAASAMLRYCCAASASSWVPASSAASSVGEGSSSKGRLAFTSTRRASSASKR